jgi:hypothetical protein
MAQHNVIKLFIGFVIPLYAAPALSESSDQKWYNAAWNTVKTTWTEGENELYIPFLSYHPPFAYSAELRSQYNDFPTGIGYGRGLYNQHGNRQSVYAMGFLDSHSKTTYMVGYSWLTYWDIPSTSLKAGLGYTAFVMSRSNFFDGTPFPGILPVASLNYKQLAIQATYTPGLKDGQGNILFMLAKWEFGKPSRQ